MANSLARTKWVCKYPIVFAPKYRRKIIYYELGKDIQKNNKRFMQMERNRNHRRSYDARSYSLIDRNTT